MPGAWRRAHVDRLPQLAAYDALVAIEAALMPWANDEQRAERLAYWQTIMTGTIGQPSSVTSGQSGHFVARNYDDFAKWLRRAGGRAAQ